MTRAIGPGQQRGSLLVAALFVLIVLAGLAVYIGSLAGVQHGSATLARDASQARYAAEGGLEILARHVVENRTCAGAPDLPAPEGFRVEITGCDSTGHTEGDTDYQVFELEAEATRGESDAEQYVARRVSMRVLAGEAP